MTHGLEGEQRKEEQRKEPLPVEANRLARIKDTLNSMDIS